MAKPTGTRGAGYGLDADLARKAAAKHDPAAENEARQWIQAVSGVRLTGTFHQALKNGQALCHLINHIKPGTISKIETANMPFKEMENISSFLRACRTLGMREHDLFETVDLFEEKDMNLVTQCIHALGRTVQVTVPEFRGPHLGVRVSTPAPPAPGRTTPRTDALDTGMTKLSMGSSGVMQRSEIRGVGGPTFGAQAVGAPVSSDVSRLNTGSAGVMSRSHIDVSKSVTFGAGASSVSAPPSVMAPPKPPKPTDGTSVAPPKPPKSTGPTTGVSSPTAPRPAAAAASSLARKPTPAAAAPVAGYPSHTAEPSGGRGAGYGMDAELERAKAAKYDSGLEQQVREWIEDVTGQAWGPSSFGQRLHDGTLLCALINAIQPNTITSVNRSTMPFKKMENISSFLRACRTLGVPEHDLFETVDLYEEKDLGIVVRCICALGRIIQTTVPRFRGRAFGPRMATSNTRVFSEEQLAKTRAETGMTKLSTGSYGVMERSDVSRSNDITFGNTSAGGSGATDVPAALNMGSSGVMQRSHISKSNDITFGHNAAGGAGATNVPVALNKGSAGVMERSHISRSNDITFGRDAGGSKPKAGVQSKAKK